MAGLVMAGFLFWGRNFAHEWLLNGNLLQSCLSLMLIIGIAAGLYGLALQLLKLQEFTTVTSKIYAKFKR
jgi:hypothetical protein